MNLNILLSKHKKKLPSYLRGTILDEWIRYGFMILISAWIFQGILYMDWREKIIKAGLDVTLTLLLVMALPWWVGLMIAHTLNFTFNGQYSAIVNHMISRKGLSAYYFINYTEKLHRRIVESIHIETALAFGSLARGMYKINSDLDIRIIPREGNWNRWFVCLWALKERSIAFIMGFPLDMYVFTLKKTATIMKKDGDQILFKGDSEVISRYYNSFVSFTDFYNSFQREQHVES